MAHYSMGRGTEKERRRGVEIALYRENERAL